MSSKIEQTIEELEQYIESCKPQTFSHNKIIVDKDQLEEFLTELRLRTPDEIKRYQKIISNQEAIMADAKAKADTIIAQAEVTHSELVSEHQIMQQAYAQANEVVMLATKQAQDILDKATTDANEIRMYAIKYTDDLLKNLETILTGAIGEYNTRHSALVAGLNSSLQQVLSNRAELMPETELAEEHKTEQKRSQSSQNREAAETTAAQTQETAEEQPGSSS